MTGEHKRNCNPIIMFIREHQVNYGRSVLQMNIPLHKTKRRRWRYKRDLCTEMCLALSSVRIRSTSKITEHTVERSEGLPLTCLLQVSGGIQSKLIGCSISIWFSPIASPKSAMTGTKSARMRICEYQDPIMKIVLLTWPRARARLNASDKSLT